MIYDLLESDEKGLRYTRLKLREPANSILRKNLVKVFRSFQSKIT